MNEWTYYDGRSVIQRSSMREIEMSLRSLELPLQVANFPSGHKVWRVCGLGAAPTIELETEECGEVVIRPSYGDGLHYLLTEWRDV